LNLYIYEIVFSLFAKSQCRIQTIQAYLDVNLHFYENQLKVSDIEGKTMMTTQSSTTTHFLKPLKKTLQTGIDS